MNAGKTSPQLRQIRSFVNAMVGLQYDHDLRLVFADFLEEEAGWSEEEVLPLRDGSLTGRYPVTWSRLAFRDPYGWLPPRPCRDPRHHSRTLPLAVFNHLPSAGFGPGYESWSTTHVARAWEALRAALLRWATTPRPGGPEGARCQR